MPGPGCLIIEQAVGFDLGLSDQTNELLPLGAHIGGGGTDDERMVDLTVVGQVGEPINSESQGSKTMLEFGLGAPMRKECV